jgi:hypothetical protein
MPPPPTVVSPKHFVLADELQLPPPHELLTVLPENWASTSIDGRIVWSSRMRFMKSAYLW